MSVDYRQGHEPEPKFKPMDREALLRLIDTMREEIVCDASAEGYLCYGWSDEKGIYNVDAFFRTGNDQGQGGSVSTRSGLPHGDTK